MRLEIRRRGVTITDKLRTYLKERLRLAFGRFAHRIDLIRVYLREVKGPRGRMGKNCRIVAELPPRGRVILTGEAANVSAAIANTAKRAGFAVRRHLLRRRASRRPSRRSLSVG